MNLKTIGKWIDSNKARVRLYRSPSDIYEAKRKGQFLILLGVTSARLFETCYRNEQQITYRVERMCGILKHMGVRIVRLVNLRCNRLFSAAIGNSNMLSVRGSDLLHALLEYDFLLCLTGLHANEIRAIGMKSKKKVIFSASNFSDVRGHPLNVAKQTLALFGTRAFVGLYPVGLSFHKGNQPHTSFRCLLDFAAKIGMEGNIGLSAGRFLDPDHSKMVLAPTNSVVSKRQYSEAPLSENELYSAETYDKYGVSFRRGILGYNMERFLVHA